MISNDNDYNWDSNYLDDLVINYEFISGASKRIRD